MKELGDDHVGHLVVHGATEEDDPVSQQSGVDIEGPLFGVAQGNDYALIVDAVETLKL